MAPFRLADAEELLALIRGVGYGDVAHRLMTLPAPFGAPDEIIDFYVAERGAALDPPQRAAFLHAACDTLAPNVTPDGVVFTMESNVVLARS